MSEFTEPPPDVIVLGAGPVGENVAERTASAGLRTVIVESELVGGECSYWACMPSKALLRPVTALHGAQSLPGARAAVRDGVDPTDVLANRDSFASHWSDDSQVEWLRGADIALVRGAACLTAPREVTVSPSQGEQYTLRANHAVVVCTGSDPVLPEIPGLAEVGPWTNRQGTASSAVPDALAVVGGGPVGVELATAWAALGAHVTLLVRGERLLTSAEPFAGELVATGLARYGVDIRFGTQATGATRADDGTVTVTLDSDAKLHVSEVLIATGRTPRTTGLGLETVGLSDGASLTVDDAGRALGVDDDWLYAAGDVTNRAPLTHQGKYQARMAGQAVVAATRGHRPAPRPWSPYASTADHVAVPQVVFSDPEVATVGPTLRAARHEGLDVVAVDHDLGSVAGAALQAEDYQGHARLVIDRGQDVIVGATFVGPQVAELLHAATIAIVGEVPIARLEHAVPSYPTVSEVWLRLLETYRSGDMSEG